MESVSTPLFNPRNAWQSKRQSTDNSTQEIFRDNRRVQEEKGVVSEVSSSTLPPRRMVTVPCEIRQATCRAGNRYSEKSTPAQKALLNWTPYQREQEAAIIAYGRDRRSAAQRGNGQTDADGPLCRIEPPVCRASGAV
jgi:hypothetical protein